MSKMLSGQNVAILTANGFNQHDLIEAQKALLAAGAKVKIISPDQGLISGWDGQGWGHNFPVDQALATALGADYDMLVIPGGSRALDKLQTTAHTRRFINNFMTMAKPVALFGDAASILVFAEQANGRVVAVADSAKDVLVAAGATVVDDVMAMDGNLMSSPVVDGEQRQSLIAQMLDFFAGNAKLAQAA
ncbi:DJ-1/PfpI family protein [Micavibrio aeruginosavorus]|uniref:DJ-1/PfpI family protein n=1 Tax=Micavibrio aeruginosavorus (strain ARL-13) TaxID=856793 RepID=G2KSK2_MICAA|nr:DJ-1/PfpI family protein [Micavibrio aeruginosavorus]AEP09286.1 DJ-1/PfpI family protein [Micavibrio aeruginosavorus ARL-13]